jgi:hypothetical protein
VAAPTLSPLLHPSGAELGVVQEATSLHLLPKPLRPQLGLSLQEKWHLCNSRILLMGNGCPVGFYASGNYCLSSPSNQREAMEKQGNSCPIGWFSSGRYCVKSR